MTRSEIAGLRRINSKRPEWRWHLKRALQADPCIATMCEGYGIAASGLEYWRAADGAERDAKLDDLQLLQRLLERLIQSRLDQIPQPKGRSNSPISEAPGTDDSGAWPVPSPV